MKTIIDIYKQFFPGSMIYFIPLVRLNNMMIRLKDNGISFLDMEYKNNTIYVWELKRTTNFSGKTILLRLKEMCENIECIHSIIINEDSSELVKDNIEIDLAILNILYRGESWYNSLGYRQFNYNQNHTNWNIIRQKTFQNVMIPNTGNLAYSRIFEYETRYNASIAHFIDAIGMKDEHLFPKAVKKYIKYIITKWYDILQDDLSVKTLSEVGRIIYILLHQDISRETVMLFEMVINGLALVIPYNRSDLILQL